jgi:hypothetical protein
MPGIRSTLLAASLLMGLATTGRAQAAPATLVPGARVRVHQGSESLTGLLVSLDSAGLVIATDKSDTVTAPRTSITAVEVSTGTKSRAGKGALIGLGVGAAAGVIVGLAASSSDNGDFLDYGAGTWAAAMGLTGAAIGAGLGALIGSGQQSDKWQPAVLPAIGVRAYGSGDNRVAIGLRIRF